MAQRRTEARENFKNSELTEKIIGAAIKVHKALGPGYVEQLYQRALAHEFSSQNIKFEREKKFEVSYEGKIVGFGVLDFLVEDEVIVELKAVSELGEVHLAQALSYLKAIGKKVGLLLNFARPKLEIKRVAL